MSLQAPSRKNLYSVILSKLRGLMIARMAKPEEVIVVEDENGNIVRETMKDTDTLARYKTMHETLVYLSNLGHEDTETQMLEQLRKQVIAGSDEAAAPSMPDNCCTKLCHKCVAMSVAHTQHLQPHRSACHIA